MALQLVIGIINCIDPLNQADGDIMPRFDRADVGPPPLPARPIWGQCGGIKYIGDTIRLSGLLVFPASSLNVWHPDHNHLYGIFYQGRCLSKIRSFSVEIRSVGMRPTRGWKGFPAPNGFSLVAEGRAV